MPEETKPQKFELSPSVAILISGLLIAGSILFINTHPAQPAVAENNQLPANANVPAPTASDHIVGSPSAPIVLVEYSDFQCPYCAMVYPTLKRIVSESQGQIAWIYREYPLVSIHPQAKPAALAAECITEQLGNDGFWKFADTIFNDQSKMAPAYYAQLAAQMGADSTKFAACVSSEKYQSVLDQGTQEAESNGGNGTPFTVVVGNGVQVPVSGAQPYANFMAVINAIKARQ
ncbi:MAG TPA: thioredoxin domain-containing protein [Candidatus Paceibacterota bacterium]|nr:thioredoxin domain-containing protein [Candidatus Paceibacterota bacterium]